MRRAPAGAAPRQARQEAALAAFAQALAATAGDAPVRAIEALAATVVNRMRAARARRGPPSWGLDLASAVAASGLAAPSGAPPPALAEACRRIAARAAAFSLPDPTGGAIAWARLGAPAPEEGIGGEAIAIGGFVFLRPGSGPGPDAAPAPGAARDQAAR